VKYRITCLTPTLIGDGQRLAPIDYMVWKEHVNVLDQRRIFRLLSKGPRLDGYLAQLKKVDKLDFASWGGFAQNFAGRRIPFEHPSSVPVWERAHSENLFIPTFAALSKGPYIPATALKGALRTGAVFERWNDATFKNLAERMAEERPPRNPASKAEDAALGGSSSNRMRRFLAGDSAEIGYASMKVYLVRVATLVARGAGQIELGWKSVRGSADARHIEDSTPFFIEMATPGTTFEGSWTEKNRSDRTRLFQAANKFAASQLASHATYAASTGLSHLATTVQTLQQRLEAAIPGESCLLSLGWGGGLLSKAAADPQSEEYRQVLRNYPFYQRALQTGLPLPKTRRVVFEQGHPASLPGWVLLETH
jgi:CRISPR-associated protein Csm5